MMRHLIMLASLAVLLVLTRAAVYAGAPQKSVLHITALNCIADLGAKPDLTYLRMNDRSFSHAFLDGPTSRDQTLAASSRLLMRGVRQYTALVDPGNYEIYARSKSCTSQVMASVLPGHERSVTIALTGGMGSMNMLFDHDHDALAGTVGLPGVTLDLVSASDPTNIRAVTSEGGAFYVDSLQRMPWILDVHVGCCETASFPIDLTRSLPGDFVSVDLTASEVIARIGYSGSMFSDPAHIAPDGNVVWYTNPSRHAVGFVRQNGSVVEYAQGEGSMPWIIAGDGRGGAWFGDARKLALTHVDQNGALEPQQLQTHDRRYDRIEAIVMQGDVAWAIAPSPGMVYAAAKSEQLKTFNAPASVDLSVRGVDGAGNLWFNVRDGNGVASINASGFKIKRVGITQVAPDIVGRMGTFFALPDFNSQHQHSNVQEVAGIHYGSVVVSPVSNRGVNGGLDGYAAARDYQGGVWISECTAGKIVHIVNDKINVERTLPKHVCPIELLADREGGIWYTASRSNTLVYIDRNGVDSDFVASDPGVLPRDIQLDHAGTLWVTERGANKIAYLSGAHFVEIDIGNPGATPHLKLVP